MSAVLEALSESRWARPAAIALGALALIGLAWAAWSAWSGRYESRGAIALTQARILLAQAAQVNAPLESRDQAQKAFEAFIADYPRHSAVAQAGLQLGNLRYALGLYPQARAAFETARGKAKSPSLIQLAQLGIGYTWEAEKNYDAAEKAYRTLTSTGKPKDFLYEEALVDIARVQELSSRRPAAFETYQKLLKDLPDSRRAEEYRVRVADLQASGK